MERTIVLDCQKLGSFPLPSNPAAANLPPGISSAKLEPLLTWRENRQLELQRLIFMIKACHTVGYYSAKTLDILLAGGRHCYICWLLIITI